ncbi:hypothetical protein F4678DRAFT_485218 [Xylaria arbuscula]|nr:hypothetical protein F4678DRAFT_485218 [Xylaria arbuscula]
MRKETGPPKPVRRVQTVLGPAIPLQDARENEGPATSQANPATAAPWPPPHFTEQEIVWLFHEHILSQVYGITADTNIVHAGQLPQVPDAYTHPLDIRLFLAFTALSNFRSDRKTSLCMTPITFWDDDERKDWDLATGGAAQFCWTTWEFCEWAKREFARGREAVAGLCHFSKTVPRHSVGILIRKRKKDKYELIMEDACHDRLSSNPDDGQDNRSLYLQSGIDFKSALLEDVEAHFKLISTWYGGKVRNAFAEFRINLADSVSASCSFIVLAAQEKVPKKNLTRKPWNFTPSIPEKIRYWNKRNAESAEEEKAKANNELEDSVDDDDNNESRDDE